MSQNQVLLLLNRATGSVPPDVVPSRWHLLSSVVRPADPPPAPPFEVGGPGGRLGGRRFFFFFLGGMFFPYSNDYSVMVLLRFSVDFLRFSREK